MFAAWPLLDNGFYGDDFWYLLQLSTVGLRGILTVPWGGHMLVVRNLVFYLCFLAFGLEPTGYFVVAVATHVAVSLGVGALARRLTGDALLGCFAGVLFAVAPANHGTLGWQSAFGHALAAAAVLAGLLVIAPRPGDGSALSPRAAACAALAMLVASQCFGTGAAAALVFPLVALLLRPATLSSPLPRAILAAVPVIVVLAWLAAMRVLVRDPAGIQTAKMFAGLAADVRHVGLVALHLAGMGLIDLLLGLPFPAASYGNALSLATSALFGLAVSVILVRGRAWMRRVLLALLLLVATSYLVVSAVRASLYVAASKGNLLSVLVQGTRHHYLSQSVLAVAVALVLAELGCLLRPAVWTRAGLVGAWTGWALATPLLFNPHVGRLEDPRVARVRAQLEQAIRNEPVGTTVCLPVEPVFLTLDFPGTLGVFALYHPGDEFEGRRVRFMSSDPKLLALRGTSERMQRLLLPDGACPGVDGEPD